MTSFTSMGHSYAMVLPPASMPAVQAKARTGEQQQMIARGRSSEHWCCPLLRASTAPARSATASMSVVRMMAASAATSTPQIAREQSSGPCWYLQQRVVLLAVVLATVTKMRTQQIARERSSGPCWHLQLRAELLTVTSAAMGVWPTTWTLARTSKIAMERNSGHFPPLLRRRSLATATLEDLKEL